MRERLPRAHVLRCAQDADLQDRARRQHCMDPGEFEDALNDALELNPGVSLDRAEWVWIHDPDDTGEALTSRTGWLLWIPATGAQLYFHRILGD